MLDILNVTKYQENNRIEAKKSLGGFPQSVWETYSAFANTLGGVILLGVEERSDKTFHLVDLKNRDSLINEFWSTLNDKSKISKNILKRNQVQKIDIDGYKIIMITVPKAHRLDRPIYIGESVYDGTYYRSGEGDIKCSKKQVNLMLNDAKTQSQDMKCIERMDVNVFNVDSLNLYRQTLISLTTDRVFSYLPYEEFLIKIGSAVRKGQFLYPTVAGLLTFGNKSEILKFFPNYSLEYYDICKEQIGYNFKLTTKTQEWSGNLFDFYVKVSKNLENINLDFLKNQESFSKLSIILALKEALINCIVNADFNSEKAIVIKKYQNKIIFCNSGSFRIDVEVAKSGGISDPRNEACMKAFNFIGVGDRSGSGIPSMCKTWIQSNLKPIKIEEFFNPNKIQITMPLEINNFNEYEFKDEDSKDLLNVNLGGINNNKSSINLVSKQLIVDFLTVNISANLLDLAKLINKSKTQTKDYVQELINENIVVEIGEAKNLIYKLKS